MVVCWGGRGVPPSTVFGTFVATTTLFGRSSGSLSKALSTAVPTPRQVGALLLHTGTVLVRVRMSVFPLGSACPVTPPWVPLLLSSDSLVVSRTLVFKTPSGIPTKEVRSVTTDRSGSLLGIPLAMSPVYVAYRGFSVSGCLSALASPVSSVLPVSLQPGSAGVLYSTGSFSSTDGSSSDFGSSSSIFPQNLIPTEKGICG